MSQISPKMRIVAAAGLVLVVAAAAFKLLVHPAQASSPAPVVVPSRTAVQTHASSTPKKAATHAPAISSGLPAPLRHALQHSRVVVAVLYAPDSPGDKDAVAEARKGAHDAKVGFAILNIRDEAVARGVARQVHGAYDPAVLVVRRPGTVALQLNGFADATVVAQAAANARR